MFPRTQLPVHCAPLERQTIVAPRVYKHLAPLEPEHDDLYIRSTYYIIFSNWIESV